MDPAPGTGCPFIDLVLEDLADEAAVLADREAIRDHFLEHPSLLTLAVMGPPDNPVRQLYTMIGGLGGEQLLVDPFSADNPSADAPQLGHDPFTEGDRFVSIDPYPPFGSPLSRD